MYKRQTQVSDGNWHIIGIRWDSKGIYLYLDNAAEPWSTTSVGNGITIPSTPHMPTVQLQDTTQASTAGDIKPTTAWIAAYA